MNLETQRAYCTHRYCDPKQVSANGVQKIVARGTAFCPDCKNLLVWRDPHRRAHVASSKIRKPVADYHQSMFDNV